MFVSVVVLLAAQVAAYNAPTHNSDYSADQRLPCVDKSGSLASVSDPLTKGTTRAGCGDILEASSPFYKRACINGGDGASCPVACGICTSCGSCSYSALAITDSNLEVSCGTSQFTMTPGAYVAAGTSCTLSCKEGSRATPTARVCGSDSQFDGFNPVCKTIAGVEYLSPPSKFKPFNMYKQKVYSAYFEVSNLNGNCTTPLSGRSISKQVVDALRHDIQAYFELSDTDVKVTAVDSYRFYVDIVFSVNPVPCISIYRFNSNDDSEDGKRLEVTSLPASVKLDQSVKSLIRVDKEWLEIPQCEYTNKKGKTMFITSWTTTTTTSTKSKKTTTFTPKYTRPDFGDDQTTPTLSGFFPVTAQAVVPTKNTADALSAGVGAALIALLASVLVL